MKKCCETCLFWWGKGIYWKDCTSLKLTESIKFDGFGSHNIKTFINFGCVHYKKRPERNQ